LSARFAENVKQNLQPRAEENRLSATRLEQKTAVLLHWSHWHAQCSERVLRYPSEI
jgi:hypothetical protein